MTKLTSLALGGLLIAGCGASPAAMRASAPAQAVGALQAEAAKPKPAYGKVLQLSLWGFDKKVAIEGQRETLSLHYTAWLQAGPDRLGAWFTKQHPVSRVLTIETRKVGAGWEPVNMAVQTLPFEDGESTANTPQGAPTTPAMQALGAGDYLTVVKDGKPVPGVAPGLKSIDTELQALVAEIRKKKVFPQNPSAEDQLAILWFAATFRSYIARN